MNKLPLIVEPSELNAQLGNKDLLIIDLCSEQNYLSGHVPGAVYVPPQALMSGIAPAPGRLPDEERLQRLFSHLGLTNNTHLVVYDDEGGGWAGRFIWTLDVIGHHRHSYLNGGIHAWKNDIGELETQINQPSPNPEFQFNIDRQPLVEIDEILAGLGQSDFVIWDARSPQEYRGEKVLAQKSGHIPGAINCEWTNLMDPNRDLRIREDAEARLASLGITGDKPIITHCQSHHRSGFTYLVGKTLGFNIRAYAGSWSEWGNHPDTPVEQ